MMPVKSTSIENRYWKSGSLPVDATAAIDLQSDPAKAAQMISLVPAQLQTLSFGLVAETHTQGFVFEEDQSQFHESLWELLAVVMRLYLMLFFIDARKIENMVTLIHDNKSEEGPPITSITLALKPSVMFDNPEIALAIRQTSPKSIVWMSKSISEGGNPVASYKVLTPCLIGNVDVEFSPDGIDMRSAVDPRYPDLDPFTYLDLVPLLNVEDYIDDGNNEDEDDEDEDDEEGEKLESESEKPKIEAEVKPDLNVPSTAETKFEASVELSELPKPEVKLEVSNLDLKVEGEEPKPEPEKELKKKPGRKKK